MRLLQNRYEHSRFSEELSASIYIYILANTHTQYMYIPTVIYIYTPAYIYLLYIYIYQLSFFNAKLLKQCSLTMLVRC